MTAQEGHQMPWEKHLGIRKGCTNKLSSDLGFEHWIFWQGMWIWIMKGAFCVVEAQSAWDEDGIAGLVNSCTRSDGMCVMEGGASMIPNTCIWWRRIFFPLLVLNKRVVPLLKEIFSVYFREESIQFTAVNILTSIMSPIIPFLWPQTDLCLAWMSLNNLEEKNKKDMTLLFYSLRKTFKYTFWRSKPAINIWW